MIGTIISSALAVGNMIMQNKARKQEQANLLQQQKNERNQAIAQQAMNQRMQQQKLLSQFPISGVAGATMFKRGGFIDKFYEAEAGEVVQGKPKVHSGGSLKSIGDNTFEIKGRKHSSGGVKMSGGEFIWSDQLSPSKELLEAFNQF